MPIQITTLTYVCSSVLERPGMATHSGSGRGHELAPTPAFEAGDDVPVRETPSEAEFFDAEDVPFLMTAFVTAKVAR